MRKLLNEEIKYTGPRFNIIRRTYKKEDELIYTRDCVEPGNSVVILPITEENEVIFVKQQREVIKEITLELPAGMIDECELPKEAAKRELEEEVGIKANYLEFLTDFYVSCGYTNERMYIYLAKEFSKSQQKFDETEEILNIEKIHIEQCMKKLLNNEFEHADIKIALYTYYYKYYNGGKNGKNKTTDNIN